MSFAPEYHVPGAYRFQPTPRPGPLSAGIFRPPVSPSESHYDLVRSTGSLYSDISMSTAPATGTTKRKRVSTRESTPVEWNMDGADQEKRRSGAQFRYNLAGQLNATPLGMQNTNMEDSVYSDVDYRRALGPKRVCEEVESPSVQLEPQTDTPRSAAPAWGTLALHTIGDVVGKVWEFCKTGAFRGFHAGGGKGYDVKLETSESRKPWCNEHDIPTLPTESPQTIDQLPGYFPQSDYMPYSPECHETTTPDSTPRPAAKRRQVSENNELKRNWVLVDEPQNQQPPSYAAAPSKAPKPSTGRPSNARPAPTRTGRPSYYAPTAASSGRRTNVPISRLGGGTLPTLPRGRTSLRISHAGSPNLTTREPASFAPPRSPVTHGTPSRIPIPTQSHNSSFSFPNTSAASLSRPTSRQSRIASPAPSPSPTKGHRRNHSGASAATMSRRSKGVVDVDDIQASPRLDAEAKQLAQKKLAVERDTDMRVDAFNARLLKMIQQGKEALGTTVEVIEDETDGYGGTGWVDDD